jgi:hypothetical protein
MARISSLDELVLSQYQIFFLLVLLLELGSLICQLHVGIFDSQSIQLHTYYLYHDHNDQLLVCSLMSPSGLFLRFMRTMFLLALSICDRNQRISYLDVHFDSLLSLTN